MRCMACGAEMMLLNVDRDDSMAVFGCEHHALKCSECQVVKWHLAFIRHNRASPPTQVQGRHLPLCPLRQSKMRARASTGA
jgi:hypothetical protein